MSEQHIDFQLYRYTPSLAASILFVVLFTLTTAYHIYQVIRPRCWYFLVFVIGGVFQIIGYICRTIAHSDTKSIPLYSVQTLLILLAPPLYAASIYMTLGRLVTHLEAEKLSLIPVKWLTKIFVAGDVISFLLQGTGGGVMASGSISAMTLGENITIAGLVVQLLFFGVFIIVAILFHLRIRRTPTQRSLTTGTWRTTTWETVMWGLYISSLLILIRSIFRLVEYAQGNDGYLISHEAFMYVFDAALMFLAMVAMSVYHPAGVLGKMGGGEGEKEGGTPLQSVGSV